MRGGVDGIMAEVAQRRVGWAEPLIASRNPSARTSAQARSSSLVVAGMASVSVHSNTDISLI